MRQLFISERRYIQSILQRWTGCLLKVDDAVVLEQYAPPRTTSKVRFNNDYWLQLVSDDERARMDGKCYCAPVLPNTLGADVFIHVEARTLRPFLTELLAGEAFSMKYFKEHVEKIEDHLARLGHAVALRRTAYCRIFVIENDICFLAFPKDPVPVAHGRRQLLSADAESSIACAVEGPDIVYVDGWIRTFVPPSERKLEAIAVGGVRGMKRGQSAPAETGGK